MLARCETISAFFAQVDAAATEERRRTWAVLQARGHARVWVVLAGDVPDAINATAAALTQGVRNHIDIGRIAHFVDRGTKRASTSRTGAPAEVLWPTCSAFVNVRNADAEVQIEYQKVQATSQGLTIG